jgi:ribonuclease R
MMQAVYSPENIGHYGLAAEHYLHFTSPIRRYPDLVVHRLLKEEWARRQGRPVRGTPEPALEQLAAHASERERAAMEAEREIAGFYAALFMRDKVGERFEGVVASVVEFGLFVELERWYVEGLIRAEDLGDALELDPALHALVDRTTGRAFRVGDKVTVEVASASPARRRIEFLLVAARAEEAKPKRARRGGARQAEAGEVSAHPPRPRRVAAGGARGERPGQPAGAARERRGEGHVEHRPGRRSEAHAGRGRVEGKRKQGAKAKGGGKRGGKRGGKGGRR